MGMHQGWGDVLASYLSKVNEEGAGNKVMWKFRTSVADPKQTRGKAKEKKKEIVHYGELFCAKF